MKAHFNKAPVVYYKGIEHKYSFNNYAELSQVFEIQRTFKKYTNV